MEEKRRHINLVGPTILIGAGIILLLNNMGYLNWSMWDAVRLWPVLLIAAGLEILVGRRSILGSIIAAVLVLAMILGGVWLVGTYSGSAAGETITIREPLNDTTSARVVLSPAAAQIEVDALKDSGNFVEGAVHPARNERINQDFKPGDNARLTVGTQGAYSTIGSESGRLWNFSFHPDVALDLEADFGAGEANLDLSGLSVTKVNASFGVGQVTITLPNRGDLTVNVDGAIGSIIIEVPRGMAVRVRANAAIVGRDIPYPNRDGVYTSPGYENADSHAEIDLGLAIGSIVVRESRGD